MSLTSNIVVAFGLSADAFAVSVGRGASRPAGALPAALRTGLLFGAVEAAMVLAGYLLATGFAGVVTGVDHWIALVLLSAVGGHMIAEGLGAEAHVTAPKAPGTGRLATLVAAVGTSIDGAAIGVTFAFIAVEIWAAVVTVGLVSTAMSTLGMLIGPRVGALLGRRAEVVGGTVLVVIGLSIFYRHMTGG